MLQLKLFGAPGLERDGVQLTGRASQRHRLALLALLAQAPGDRLSRDKLIAFLWPESDPERSRNLLKVATYVLRSTLGDDALVSTGDDLRLNTDLVRVDSVELEAALARSDFERAVTLYTGPFLDGFFLSEAPEFDHWVDRERDRLAGGYRRRWRRWPRRPSPRGISRRRSSGGRRGQSRIPTTRGWRSG
jgi:serine/threonine-protein kinase